MWVARDKNGNLSLFNERPERYFNVWMQRYSIEVSIGDLNPTLFPDLRWEDEPLEVELRADDKHDIKESIKDYAQREVLRLVHKWINDVLTQYDITDNGYTIDASDLELNFERYCKEMKCHY